MVPSTPPSPWAGRENSIVWPLRRRPRERSWLFMYREAVRRLSDSIVDFSLVWVGEKFIGCSCDRFRGADGDDVFVVAW
jgi:hypothetical protein